MARKRRGPGGDARARADALLSVADAAPPGEIRAGHLLLAASALAEAGDASRHRETLQAAFEAWPADDATFRGALAWADERDAARAALRAALRELPAWAERGIRSRDVTFPVSVDLVRREGESRDAGRTALSVVPPVARRHAAVLPARPEVLLDIVRAWRAAHVTESPV
ncbi:MAG: hypothetical protein WCJ30_25260 [Deltaproteobacteria bacterium]